jgi:hypothetical protein
MKRLFDMCCKFFFDIQLYNDHQNKRAEKFKVIFHDDFPEIIWKRATWNQHYSQALTRIRIVLADTEKKKKFDFDLISLRWVFFFAQNFSTEITNKLWAIKNWLINKIDCTIKKIHKDSKIIKPSRINLSRNLEKLETEISWKAAKRDGADWSLENLWRLNGLYLLKISNFAFNFRWDPNFFCV